MIPANDDAMSSIDLFMNSISKIILESKPKKAVSNTGSDKAAKKSIKAKKVLNAPEVKKVESNSKSTSKKPKEDKEKLGDNRDE
jgi:ribosomal protein S2